MRRPVRTRYDGRITEGDRLEQPLLESEDHGGAARYTQVVETTGPGRTVYLSGQLGMTADGNFAGAPGDFRAQATQCFENLKAGLASVGGGFEHVVKITNFFVNMAHLPLFFEVRDRYVNTKAPPASTAIQIGRLARRGRVVRGRGGGGHPGPHGKGRETNRAEEGRSPEEAPLNFRFVCQHRIKPTIRTRGDFVFGRPGWPVSWFPFPPKMRGWSAGRRRVLRYGTLEAGLRGPPAHPRRVPVAGVAACGVRAANDVGRCASRGSTAMPLSGTAPRSVIRRRLRRRPR